jgi:SAM-dependent methyltransferase
MSADGPWSDTGYVTEVPYTREFFRFQTPLQISFAAMCNGLGAPDPASSFDYIDLGCGEAITLLILAACHPQARFVGIDMNPAHIETATAMARAAGLDNLEFEVAQFDDYAERTTRRFDYIAAHGIYTWVNEEARCSVRKVVAQTLKPGGLFYLCHYVRPGADRTKALYDLIQASMEDHDQLPIVARIRATIADLRALQAADEPIFKMYSDLDDDLEDLETRDDRYLAHEFGNKHFEPLTFAHVARDLVAQGLMFAGSTRVDRNRAVNRIGAAALDHLKGLDETTLEVRMSYLAEEAFRWDVFARSDAPRPQEPALREIGGHLGFGHSDSRRKMPRTETHGQRKIIFDTPEIQTLLTTAYKGLETLGTLIDANSDDPKAGVSRLRDVAATLVFEPQLRPNVQMTPDSKTTYRHTLLLSAVLFDRDFSTEAVGIFPAPIRGTALQLYGVQAIAARLLDGRTPGDALEAAREWVDALPPESTNYLDTPPPADREAFNLEAVIFLRRTLPLMLSWGVVVPAESAAPII